MARLPNVEPAGAPPEVREVLEALPRPLNVFKLMAHAETNFRPLLRLGSSILTEQQLAATLRELAILATARRCGAEYEWTQHVAIATAVGVSEDQVAALAADRLEAPCFDARERAVLAATADIVRDGRLPETHFTTLTAQLSTREIVELVLAVGFYMMLARLMVVTDIDPDPPIGADILLTRLR
jgi:alkylhydroperoxidase family enzyme